MRVRELAGSHDGAGLRVGVAVAEFNRVITRGLLEGALAALEAAGVPEVTVVRVPGALELPLAAARLAEGHDAVVALGAVIRGDTDHYEHVATQACAGLRQVALAARVPVANGVLTVRETAHARERSAPGPGNKGAEAVEAAILTLRALQRLGDPR
ncbi:MAG: 6,7-dimethyl-8-ribityllumazine synthase [Thermoanaerobaculia bacterium]|nr:6,7-dimethyl-8-ribityllumazine synthase [Thermoanaerobaculia bacterium]